jgi:hypothetical protein
MQTSFTFVLLSFVLAVPVLAQRQVVDGRPVAYGMRLEAGTSVHLDGRLDEAFWSDAVPITDFLQQEPREGGTPTERTDVRIAYDRDHLYIGATLYDSEPGGILAFQKRRDVSLATDDRFMWIIDTFNDGRSGYFFEINPAGLLGDGLLRTGQGGNLNKSWDGIWDVRVSRGSYGWMAEIRIPFRTLNFNPTQEVWGINFQRTIRRKNEELLWAGHRRNQGLQRPQNAGQLIGLAGMSQGLGLEVVPYTLASGTRSWADDGEVVSSDPTADAGFDVTYSLTTNLRASATVNTDFAETEVDERRVNLTRFPLRYPEQRDFFLEGSGVFEFAPSSSVYPYFSRRIGLEGGRPIPILAGGRMAGQLGDFDVGLIQVRTRESGPIPAEDFTAARLVRNIFSESTVGIVYTRRATHGPAAARDRHTFGGDLEMATSRFLGDRVLQFQLFFVGHTEAVPGSGTNLWDRSSRGLRLAYPNDPWSFATSYREFGAAFDPAVGFTQRRAFRRFQPTLEYAPLLENSDLIREVSTELRFEYLTTLDFEPETVETRLTPGIRFESGDEVAVSVSRNFERLFESFDIRRDGSIIVPVGRYFAWSGEAEASTASHRRVAISGAVSHAGFWTGAQSGYSATATVRPTPGLNLSAFWSHDHVDLGGGAFGARLIRASGSLDLTPRTSLTSNVQYDNLSELVGLFARFRWTVQPGSDVFLVYTHNWLNDPLDFRSLEQQAAAKVTYTHRF